MCHWDQVQSALLRILQFGHNPGNCRHLCFLWINYFYALHVFSPIADFYEAVVFGIARVLSLLDVHADSQSNVISF